MIRIIITLFAVFALSNSAQAAIYKCVNAKGVASFSQHPCPKQKIDKDTDEQKLFHQLKALTAEGEHIVHSVTGNYESIKLCQGKAAEFHYKWKKLQPQVDTLSKEFKSLSKAYQTLENCGICKSRGRPQCSKTRNLLNAAQNMLVKSNEQRNPKGWAYK
jgi:Domain of unknown function (DUF4124)